jgi:large subunit ribosomal protein L35
MPCSVLVKGACKGLGVILPANCIYPGKENKMPKMKTHRAAAKRYKVTGTGKITRRHAGIGHLLQHKSESRKRKIFGDLVISETHEKLVSKELPYKKYSR